VTVDIYINAEFSETCILAELQFWLLVCMGRKRGRSYWGRNL